MTLTRFLEEPSSLLVRPHQPTLRLSTTLTQTTRPESGNDRLVCLAKDFAHPPSRRWGRGHLIRDTLFSFRFLAMQIATQMRPVCDIHVTSLLANLVADLAVVEVWHIHDSYGQILALAFRLKFFTPCKWFPLRSEAEGLKNHTPPRGTQPLILPREVVGGRRGRASRWSSTSRSPPPPATTSRGSIEFKITPPPAPKGKGERGVGWLIGV